jgi:hypothetical protein
MDTAKQSILCRCGHARRWHQAGTIWQGYNTRCLYEIHGRDTHPDYHATFCPDFERADNWQESFVALLRSEGYIVEKMRRGANGRFLASEGI